MGARGGRRALRGAAAVAVLALAGCQSLGDGDDGGGADGPGTGQGGPCAGGAPVLETLDPADFGGVEPPPEDMAWQDAATGVVERATAAAGDRLATVWLDWEPTPSVEVRVTEGPGIPELDALVEAAAVDVNVAYDRAYSQAELLAAADAVIGAWADVPGVSGMSVDDLSSRLLFYVAAGDDGGAATCTALAEILADAGVPYAFDVFDGPTDPTVRGPVAFWEVYLVGDATLRMNVASCNGDPEVTTLEETGTEVRVEVTSTTPAPGWPGPECLDGLEVTLDAPLAGRTLIDLSTGETVDVTPLDG